MKSSTSASENGSSKPPAASAKRAVASTRCEHSSVASIRSRNSSYSYVGRRELFDECVHVFEALVETARRADSLGWSVSASARANPNPVSAESCAVAGRVAGWQ
jgi:hypothetical protein